jgi:hypothetical protein
MYGGYHLSPDCTTGFTVRYSNGSYGVTTAGHCPDSMSYNGTNLPLQQQVLQGSLDLQWHTTPGFTDDNWFSIDADTSPEKQITGVYGRDSQPMGWSACKYGRITGLDCGTVASRTFSPGYVPYRTATLHAT